MKFIVALSSLALVSLSSVYPCFATGQAISRSFDESLSSQSSPYAAKSSQVIVAQRKGTIRNAGEAALNAADVCKNKASSSLREDKSGLAVITTDCALLTHAILSALRNAKYSPKGYNLRNGRDFNKFMEGAGDIFVPNKEVKRIFANLSLFFPDSVLDEIMEGAVGAYLWLDYGIDPRNL